MRLNEIVPNGISEVWSSNDYSISVDDIDDANTATAWFNGKNIGQLTTRGKVPDPFFNEYILADKIEILRQHRNKGIGTELFRQLLKHLSNKYKGIIVYLPDVVNKKQIPTIFDKLDAKIINDDYIIIRKTVI